MPHFPGYLPPPPSPRGLVYKCAICHLFHIFIKNLFMLRVRILSCGCTREVWRARKISPRATLASWVLCYNQYLHICDIP